MEISVDIEKVEQFILSDKFRDFILNEQNDFGVAAFILQTLLDEIDEVKRRQSNGRNIPA